MQILLHSTPCLISLFSLCVYVTFLSHLFSKLTLQKFSWTVFNDNPADDCWKKFMEQVHKHLARPVQETVEVAVEPMLETHNRPYAQRLRLNTRMLRSIA